MEEVQVDIIGLQTIEGNVELWRYSIREIIRCVGALADDNDLFAQVALGVPMTKQRFHGALAVNMCSVETCAAGLEEVVPHDDGVAHRGLIVATHDKA